MPTSSSKKPLKNSQQAQDSVQVLIHPLWLLKAAIAVIAIAAVCAYTAICALFWHSQWQLVLSPARVVSANPASVGLTFEDVRFAPGAGGQPELTGWWVPTTAVNASTALVLHGGAGTMSDMLPLTRVLHDNRLNVLVFDYRGFGNSSGRHPTELRMERDAEAALSYLNNLRHIRNYEVVVFGEGLGASLATNICSTHHDVSALVLENADGDFDTRAALDPRSRLVPFGLLFNQHFPLADPLHMLATPKLLISYTKAAGPPVEFARAADPKLTVEIDSPKDTAALSETLRRFLDSYVPHSPALLLPK